MDYRLDHRESLLDVVLQQARPRRPRRRFRTRPARRDSCRRAVRHSQGRAAGVFRVYSVEALNPSAFDAPLERAGLRAITYMVMLQSPDVSPYARVGARR